MTVIGTMAFATAINGASVVKEGKDPLPTLLAASVFTLFLEYLADSVDDGLASTFAGVFLLGTFMIHYKTFTDLLDYFTAQKG